MLGMAPAVLLVSCSGWGYNLHLRKQQQADIKYNLC
jgi:hypothetical protein